MSSKPVDVKIIADVTPSAENKIIQDFLQKPFDSLQTINAERGFKRLTHAKDVALTKHYTDLKTKKCKAAIANIPLFETSNVEETCRLANTITIKCPAIIKSFLPQDLRTILRNFKDEKISYFISSQNLPSKSMPVYFRPNHWVCGLQPGEDNQIAAGVYNKEMAYSTCTTQFFSYTSNEIAIKNPTQRDIRLYSYPVNVASPSMVVCETPSDPRVTGIIAGINFENSQHIISLAVTTDRSVAVTFHLILNSADQKSLNEISQRVSNLAALIVELEKLGNTSKINAPNGPMSALRRFLNIPTLNCQLLAGNAPASKAPANAHDVKNVVDVKPTDVKPTDVKPAGKPAVLPATVQPATTVKPTDVKPTIVQPAVLPSGIKPMATITPLDVKPKNNTVNASQLSLLPFNADVKNGADNIGKTKSSEHEFSDLWVLLDKKDPGEAHAMLEKMIALKKKEVLLFNLNAHNKEGLTLIHKAIENRDAKAVQLLIAAGADVNVFSKDIRYTDFITPLVLIFYLIISEFKHRQFGDFNCHTFNILVALINAGADLCQIINGDTCGALIAKTIPLERLEGLDEPFKSTLNNLRDLLLFAHQTDVCGLLHFQGHYIDLEGTRSRIVLPVMTKIFSDFIKDNISPINQWLNSVNTTINVDYFALKNQKNNIIEVVKQKMINLNKPISAATVLHFIQDGQTFPMSVSTQVTIPEHPESSGNHQQAYLFFRNICIRINCGGSVDPSTAQGATFYEIRNENSEDLKAELKKLLDSEQYPVEDSYLVNDFVKKLDLKVFKKINFPTQMVGNCVMVSLMELLHVTLIMEIYKTCLSQNLDYSAEESGARKSITEIYLDFAIQGCKKIFNEFVHYYLKRSSSHLKERGIEATMLSQADTVLITGESLAGEIKYIFSAEEFNALLEHCIAQSPDNKKLLETLASNDELAYKDGLIEMVKNGTGAKKIVYQFRGFGSISFTDNKSYEEFRKRRSLYMKRKRPTEKSMFALENNSTSKQMSTRISTSLQEFQWVIDDMFGHTRQDIVKNILFKRNNNDADRVCKTLRIKEIDMVNAVHTSNETVLVSFNSLEDAGNFKNWLRKVCRGKVIKPDIDFLENLIGSYKPVRFRVSKSGKIVLKKFQTTIARQQLENIILSCLQNNTSRSPALALCSPRSTKMKQNIVERLIKSLHGEELDFEMDENVILRAILQELGAIAMAPLKDNENTQGVKEKQRYQINFVNQEAYQKFMLQFSMSPRDQKTLLENKYNEHHQTAMTPLKDMQTKPVVKTVPVKDSKYAEETAAIQSKSMTSIATVPAPLLL